MESYTDKKVSVIIPAYNEAQTVGDVVHSAHTHPLVKEVIVVDDGSYDTTAEIARKAGARVIISPRNKGKAAAMDLGVNTAQGDILFFMDADIIGLSHDAMSLAINSVICEDSHMFVLIIDRGEWLPRMFFNKIPLLSGIRAIKKEIWNCVPENCKNNFEIELALNYFAKRNNFTITSTIIPGLTQVIKEKKRGLWRGLYHRMFMIRDICVVILKMYSFYNAKYLWESCFSSIRKVLSPQEIKK